jgi:hypothetical protein
MTTYRHLLLHPGLLAPMRRALLARNSRVTPRSRFEVWENEGGRSNLEHKNTELK